MESPLQPQLVSTQQATSAGDILHELISWLPKADQESAAQVCQAWRPIGRAHYWREVDNILKFLNALSPLALDRQVSCLPVRV